jgi:protein-S-isoprenylcysteine O-methyltransferase Ste14
MHSASPVRPQTQAPERTDVGGGELVSNRERTSRRILERQVIRPAVWLFYLAIVGEILFMISPAGLYFYSAYGPALNFLHRSPRTAWLTGFFLPHFSETHSPLLDAVHSLPVAAVLVLTGLGLFLAGAVPIYWSKFRHQGAVTGGIYSMIRHPQYVGLAVLGLGTTLIWPRFLALIAYVTTLFIYDWLARSEEKRCLEKFRASYRSYQAKTGRYLPLTVSRMLPHLLPESGGQRTFAVWAVYVAATVIAVALAFQLRDYSLSRISAIYSNDSAVISLARLNDQELNSAYRIAVTDPGVQSALARAEAAKLIVYVMPQSWGLPDLPIEAHPNTDKFGGHFTPKDFDRRFYKVLFVKARLYGRSAVGRDIVKSTFGRDPIIVARVDLAAGRVAGTDIPPRHVYWGDIPTPLF